MDAAFILTFFLNNIPKLIPITPALLFFFWHQKKQDEAAKDGITPVHFEDMLENSIVHINISDAIKVNSTKYKIKMSKLYSTKLEEQKIQYFSNKERLSCNIDKFTELHEPVSVLFFSLATTFVFSITDLNSDKNVIYALGFAVFLIAAWRFICVSRAFNEVKTAFSVLTKNT